MKNNKMKKTVIVLSALTVSLFFTACSDKPMMPSYYKMSCSALSEKEKSLQEDMKLDSVSYVVDGIADAVDDTAHTAADAASSNIQLQATKRELRDIQRVIYEKGCQK
jgi:hypothetical protein